MTWSTAIAVTVFAALLVTSFLLWAAFLWWGARWAGIKGVTRNRVLLVTFLVAFLDLLRSVLSIWVVPATNDESILLTILNLVLAVAIPCGVISIVFKARIGRALKAWLVTLVPFLGMLAVAFFVVRPFVFEAFTVPTNSMAPTILGRHWEGTCPTCAEPAYCPPTEGFGQPESAELMICENFDLTQVRDFSKKEHWGDWLLVSKFVTARRWDLLVFRYPDDPSVLFLQRLVGLPGEEVTIRDGFVWINGEKMTPPEPIGGLRYVMDINGQSGRFRGSPDRPAKLGPEEYFVLGDFSPRALDSRLWYKGAPGHPPYAVPASYIYGVVTHIYWPPSRWRVFR